MFRLTRLRAVEVSVSINVPSHVKARSVPITDQLKQVGIKASDIENSKGGAGICARAASSLLQDWVMLAHRRPIHSTNSDPTSNLNPRTWSDEECAMISKIIQLRDFDQTKMMKMNLSPSSAHQSTALSTPRVVSRTSSSMNQQEKTDEQPTSVTSTSSASSETATSSMSGGSSSGMKLKPRIVVRQRRSTTSSSEKEASATTNNVSGNNNTLNEEKNPEVEQQQPSTTTTATPRRRVVRVGGASR